MMGCDCPHSKEWHGVDGCSFPGCECKRVPATRARVAGGEPVRPKPKRRAGPKPPANLGRKPGRPL